VTLTNVKNPVQSDSKKGNGGEGIKTRHKRKKGENTTCGVECLQLKKSRGSPGG